MNYFERNSDKWYQKLAKKNLEAELVFNPIIKLGKNLVKKYDLEDVYKAAESIEFVGLFFGKKALGLSLTISDNEILFFHILGEGCIESPFLIEKNSSKVAYPQDLYFSDRRGLLDRIASKYYQLERELSSNYKVK